MKKLPFVSIITVNYNGKHLLEGCFDLLLALNYPKNRLEIIMVDNGSQDSSIEYVKGRYPKIKIIKNALNNYCMAGNQGVRQAKGKYVVLLNNDTRVEENWLVELIRVIEQDKSIGAVSSKVLLMGGRIDTIGHQEMPNYYWSDKGHNEKDTGQYDKIEEVSSLCGCAVLYRKSALEEVGDFDEDFNMYMEDVDISIRLKNKKWRLFYVPASIVYHKHHGTAEEEQASFYTERNRLLLLAKHYPGGVASALLGRGYFTAEKDIHMHAGLYTILPDVILKLIKHHKPEVVKETLSRLFEELKKIDNYENTVLAENVKSLLDSIQSFKRCITEKDTYILSLNQGIEKRDHLLTEKDSHLKNLNVEITKREHLLTEKDSHILSLNQEIDEKEQAIDQKEQEIDEKEQELNNIHNSTAFRFIVKPLWAFLWRVKQFLKGRYLCVLNQPQAEGIAAAGTDKIAGCDEVGICTIISKNYLAYGRVLADSFLKHNKGEVFVLLSDRVDGYFRPEKERFRLIEIEELRHRIDDFEKLCFQYNATELNTAVKPFFLEFLFEKYRLKKLIFFDPDILITNNLDALFGLLERSSVILTPHITKPFNDNSKPSEIHILKSGVYNLGFIALSYTNTTKNLLRWWKERLKRYCTSDIESGLFVDQKWIDLIPGFFDDVFILRDKTYNIAYWNYHYRKAYLENSRIMIDNKPVNFLHFSGIIPQDLNSVSKHQDRFKLKNMDAMRPIFEFYRDELFASGYSQTKDLPCVFNYFDNGVRIPDIIRRIYWEMDEALKKKLGNPFSATGNNSFFQWLNRDMDKKKPPITRLMYEIHRKRPDAQLVYRDIFNSDRQAFLRWFLITTKREYNLDESFLKGINIDDTKYVWMGLKPKFVYALRNIVRSCCKRLFKNNLHIIGKLRKLEIIFYKKITDFSKGSKSKCRLLNSEAKKGVNLWGYINAEHGVGEAARANIRCLEAVGIETSLINIMPTYIRQNDTSYSSFSSEAPFYINLIHINADMLPYHCAEKGRETFQNKYNIGYWTWELSEFPEQWQKSFSYCSEIWTPSSFSLAAIAKKSPIPVLKMPPAVSLDKIRNVNRSYFGLEDDEFIFLFIFDFLSYFERKNPLAVIQAFKNIFPDSRKVKLVIKCTNPSFDPKAFTTLKEAASYPNITIINNYLYRDEVNALLSLCDCYVSLHRSEGFGLTMAEAMYLGKPVISTGYSGNCDFMNNNNSYLVRYKLVKLDKNIGPYKQGAVWAEPDIGYAAELMQHVWRNQEAAKEIGRISSSDIRAYYNHELIGNEMKRRIEYIYNNYSHNAL